MPEQVLDPVGDRAVLRVTERAVYRGPHLYGSIPMVRLTLDLGDLATVRSSDVPGLADALAAALPGLAGHRCSTGRPGGFGERLAAGTLLGHVIEHVALELQATVGVRVSRGKTRAVRGRSGVYDVLFAYEDVAVGRAAGRLAIELVAGLVAATAEGLDAVAPPLDPERGDGAIPGFGAFRRLAAARALGPSTRALVDEARRRRIPVERLDGEARIRLGWGTRQEGFSAGITSRTSHLGVLIAADKHRTKAVLEGVGIPVPRGRVVTTADEAAEAFTQLRSPVVVKPRDGNHGRGVSTGIHDADAARTAFAEAAEISARVVIEEQVAGTDHRLLVVGGRLVAAAERRPPVVTGDGDRTVAQLVAELNADPRRAAPTAMPGC